MELIWGLDVNSVEPLLLRQIAAPSGNRKEVVHFHPNQLRELEVTMIDYVARETDDNPLDVVEHLAAGNSWPFERAGEDEISIIVTGRWTNYQISFTWMSDIEALHLAQRARHGAQ